MSSFHEYVASSGTMTIDSETQNPRHGAASRALSDSATVSIIHVDDDPQMGPLVNDMLERADPRFEVFETSHPAEVLQWCRTETIACVISDYDMPNCDGITLSETITSEFPHIPVIMFSSYRPNDVDVNIEHTPVNDWIQKGAHTQWKRLITSIQGHTNYEP